jgi:hypothetical protein
MPLGGVGRLFWAAGFLGHALLLAVLFVKRRAPQFPFFTALIASNLLRTTILFAVISLGSETSYTWTYLGLSLVDITLQFGVLYELASHVFRPLGRWAPDVRSGMHWLGWGSLVVASVLTWMASSGAATWEFTVLRRGNFFSSVLLSELFLGLLVLSVTVGLPWKTHEARIAQGLGAYSILDVLIEAGHTLYGSVYQASLGEVLTFSRHVVYLLALGYWIVTLWRDAPDTHELSKEMRKELERLQARLAYDLYTIRNWRKP